MTDRAHDKETVWTDAKLPVLAPMGGDHTADVCVVGAGHGGRRAERVREARRVP